MAKNLEWHQLTEDGFYWKVFKSDPEIYTLIEYEGGTVGCVGSEQYEDLVQNAYNDEYFFVKIEVPTFQWPVPEVVEEEFDAEIHCKMLTDAIEASGILKSPGISLQTPAKENEFFPGMPRFGPRFVHCLLEVVTGLAGEGALIVRLAGNGGWSFQWVGIRYHDSDTYDFRHTVERKILNAAFKQATA
jgi:hypothetical protein